ncbi:hypothetical protein K9N68_14900 [Kovacikia minuta CCNUW1]|uniref:hypothetical protein n=1 Tax=Kovacikia minuta TaxID=2931930 RepID=UPI001CCD5F5B|nr:hypothetical protein [Kovacikia minuta]UBF29006.1 hypothetical protein K9N68_14900 [Kovacikia minuta CCNUW1]
MGRSPVKVWVYANRVGVSVSSPCERSKQPRLSLNLRKQMSHHCFLELDRIMGDRVQSFSAISYYPSPMTNY